MTRYIISTIEGSQFILSIRKLPWIPMYRRAFINFTSTCVYFRCGYNMDYGQRPTLWYHENLFQVFNMSKEYNNYNVNFILHN